MGRLSLPAAVLLRAAGTVCEDGGVGAEAAAPAAAPLLERALWKGVCILYLACKKYKRKLVKLSADACK